MCGIAGVIKDASPDELRGILRRMVGPMERRGPDGQGAWADAGVGLAHARLSIIDLSHAADQPMSHAESGVRIVFNGEIYNYLELRDELLGHGHHFDTTSDTEVLLRAYLQWGTEAFRRCIGMWALAIFDPRRRQLVLSRDRFGIKPLYIFRGSGGDLVFGSTPRVVLASGVPERKINRATVRSFLLGRSVDESPGSFFEGIEHFPAATTAVFDLSREGNAQRLERYWNPVDCVQHECSIGFDDAVREFRAKLTESVAIHTRSDVEVSSCLSGGLDSSALVSLLATIPEGRDIRRVFSATFPGRPYDEDRYSRAVAERHGLRRITIEPDTRSLLVDIEKVCEAQEEPFGSTGVYVQWKVFQAVHDAGIKVAIDGQGADEYLAGYFSFLVPFAAECLRGGNVLGAIRAWRTYRHGNRFSHQILSNLQSLAVKLLGRRMSGSQSPYQRLLGRDLFLQGPEDSLFPAYGLPAGSDVKSTLVRYLCRYSLPALLRYEDRNSMYFSVESRVPYLDHRLVEFCMSLPTEHLIDGVTTKRVLRSGVRDIVPELVWARGDKIGFGNPESEWVMALLQSGAFNDLLDARAGNELFDVGAVRGYLKAGSVADHNFVWRMFSVLQWHRQSFA